MRRKEMDITYLIRINDNVFQLTNYIGTGEAGPDVSAYGNAILVQSHIDQHTSSTRTYGT